MFLNFDPSQKFLPITPFPKGCDQHQPAFFQACLGQHLFDVFKGGICPQDISSPQPLRLQRLPVIMPRRIMLSTKQFFLSISRAGKQIHNNGVPGDTQLLQNCLAQGRVKFITLQPTQQFSFREFRGCLLPFPQQIINNQGGYPALLRRVEMHVVATQAFRMTEPLGGLHDIFTGFSPALDVGKFT